MTKRVAPPGVASAQQIYDCGQRIAGQDRAFLYGLWLTAARTAELCRLLKKDIIQENGEWYYSLPVLKWKTIRRRKRPFLLIPSETEKLMLAEFLSWLDASAPDEEGFVFSFKSHEIIRKWERKDGSWKEKKYLAFGQPYYRLVTKAGIMADLIGQSGNITRTIPPHFIRAFSITDKFERFLAADTVTLQELYLVKDWVDHAKFETTMKYVLLAPSYWKATLAKVREKIAAIESQKSDTI